MALKKITRPNGSQQDTSNVLTEGTPLRLFEGSGYRDVRTKPSNKLQSEQGLITIVSSKGKRIELSKPLLTKLNHPQVLQFLLSDTSVAVGMALPSSGPYFSVHRRNGKGFIYSAGLVRELTTVLGLDFSDRVAVTLRSAEFQQYIGAPVAIFSQTDPNTSCIEQNGIGGLHGNDVRVDPIEHDDSDDYYLYD